MNKRFGTVRKPGKENVPDQAKRVILHTGAGRVINALNYILIIIFMGLWITAFILLKDKLGLQPLSDNMFTNLTCIGFFGGLVVALFMGELAGNFLRRAFWKLLIRD